MLYSDNKLLRKNYFISVFVSGKIKIIKMSANSGGGGSGSNKMTYSQFKKSRSSLKSKIYSFSVENSLPTWKCWLK